MIASVLAAGLLEMESWGQAAGSAVREVTVAEARSLAGSGQMVRIRGTFMHATHASGFVIHDGTAGISGSIYDPPVMEPGDLLEVTGVVSKAAFDSVTIYRAEARVAGKGGFPGAIAFNAADAYREEAQRRKFQLAFVKMHGRLVRTEGFTPAGQTGQGGYPTLVLDDDGAEFLARLPRGTSGEELFVPGAVYEIEGTCFLEPIVPANRPGLIQVYPPSAGHVRLVAPPPVLEDPRYQRWLRDALVIIAVLTGLGCAWAMGKWRALRRINATLEARVAERTAELERALAKERELGEMKSRFVSLVSHEFRTPLGVIMSAADVLGRYFGRLPAEKRERHLDMITRSTRNLAGLIEEVLLLGRVEEGKMRFQPRPVDLEKICRTIADEAVSAAGGACPVEFGSVQPLDGASSDEALLRHILGNLLSNAVKYSTPGTPVEFSAARADGGVIFTIRDRGIGISPEDQARLFTSFTRGANVGSRPGTGLGLVIVQRCVRLHGGTLEVRSALGEGTTVTVSLPVFSNPQPRPPAAQ